jgi:hypothetical protein
VLQFAADPNPGSSLKPYVGRDADQLLGGSISHIIVAYHNGPLGLISHRYGREMCKRNRASDVDDARAGSSSPALSRHFRDGCPRRLLGASNPHTSRQVLHHLTLATSSPPPQLKSAIDLLALSISYRMNHKAFRFLSLQPWPQSVCRTCGRNVPLPGGANGIWLE